MVKQIVMSLVVASFVVQAQAQAKAGKEAKARDLVTEEAAKDAKKAGQVRSSKELVNAGASKKIGQYFPEFKNKSELLAAAEKSKTVAKALVEAVKSKRAGKTNEIDDAQISALLVLAKIENLDSKVKENSLAGDELIAYKAAIEVPAKARAGFDKEGQMAAAKAIDAMGQEAAKSGSTLDSALKAMETKAGIKRESIKDLC